MTTTATVTVTQPAPGISIDKTASPTTILAGADVTYTYVVTNTGNVDLDPVTVSDDNGTPGDASDDFAPTCPATKLAVGEDMTCTAVVSGIDVTTTNVAVATGNYGEDKVTDNDDATVTVEPPATAPGISIDKTASPTTIVAGAEVTYTYVVTNTGNTDLDPVTVVDDNGTPGDTGDDFTVQCPATKLAVGAHMTCTEDVTGTQVTTTNIAVATGTYGEGQKVTDSDDATVTVGSGGVGGETDTPTGPPTDTFSSTSTEPAERSRCSSSSWA